MSQEEIGVAYIITNQDKSSHKRVFEGLCNKSVNSIKSNTRSKVEKTPALPVALASFNSKDQVQADYYIDANEILQPYMKQELHGLVLAELLKTHICEWSPFKRTIYLDCDTFVFSRDVKEYAYVLSMGYSLSMTTCVTMSWKDSISDSTIDSKFFKGIPKAFPYWNFGAFGCDQENSQKIMQAIRDEFLKYCYGGKGRFVFGADTAPHAQPAIVQAAFNMSPNHGIFTMPSRFNVHMSARSGCAFYGKIVVLHTWKDLRQVIL